MEMEITENIYFFKNRPTDIRLNEMPSVSRYISNILDWSELGFPV